MLLLLVLVLVLVLLAVLLTHRAPTAAHAAAPNRSRGISVFDQIANRG